MTGTTEQDTATSDGGTAVKLYTGISQTLFELGVAGWREISEELKTEIEAKTTGAVKEAVDALETERETKDSAFQKQLEKIGFSDMDAVQTLMLGRAKAMVAFDQKIQIARMIPESEAFEKIMAAHEIPVRKPSGNSGTSTSLHNTVHKVERYGTTRYILVYEDKVTVCAADGTNSDVVVTLNDTNYPHAYASLKSQTALGILFDIGYHNKAEGFESTVARYQAVEKDFDSWHTVLGLTGKTTNGTNNMALLADETPESWLEKNPQEDKKVKKPKK